MEEESQVKEIDKYLDRLEVTTKWMKFIGTVLLAVTALHVFLVFYLTMRDLVDEGFYYLYWWLTSIGAGMFGVAAVCAFGFDQSRRKGEVLFEIISDELHAKTDSSYPDSDREQGKKISIRARYVLREFSRNSDLPLIPGKFGPAVLCLANLFFVLFYSWPRD